MDEATAELLSRHLDGDLAEAEEKAFQEQLAAEPELQAELASMERLRNAVRSFAEQEEPPGELSALLEPLRRSSPPPITVRPFYRWLAAAATLILGVTVLVEVARQNPGPQLPESLSRAPQPAPTATGYFQLQPLPTKADNGLLGAGDHLLASPPPESELEPPPPLEVMGPLEPEPEPSDITADEPGLQAEVERPEMGEQVVGGPQAETLEIGSDATLAEVDAGKAPMKAKAITEDAFSSTRRLRSAAPEADAEGTAGCTMSLIVDGKEILSTTCAPGQGMPPGRHPVVVVISAGKVSSIRSDDRLAYRSDPAGACSVMIGLSAGNAVADG
jgi:hypothetical protein